MTIIEYAEKIDALKYLSDKMIKILELYQETKNDDANAFLTIGGLRNGKAFLSTLITKYEAYQQGRADAVEECIRMVEEGVYRDYEMLAEQMRELKEQKA